MSPASQVQPITAQNPSSTITAKEVIDVLREAELREQQERQQRAQQERKLDGAWLGYVRDKE